MASLEPWWNARSTLLDEAQCTSSGTLSFFRIFMFLFYFSHHVSFSALYLFSFITTLPTIDFSLPYLSLPYYYFLLHISCKLFHYFFYIIFFVCTTIVSLFFSFLFCFLSFKFAVTNYSSFYKIFSFASILSPLLFYFILFFFLFVCTRSVTLPLFFFFASLLLSFFFLFLHTRSKSLHSFVIYSFVCIFHLLFFLLLRISCPYRLNHSHRFS